MSKFTSCVIAFMFIAVVSWSADVASVKSELTATQKELEQDRANMLAAAKNLNAKNEEAFARLVVRAKFDDAQKSLQTALPAIPTSPAKTAFQTKLDGLGQKVDQVLRTNLECLAAYKTSYADMEKKLTALSAKHAELGALVGRLGTDSTAPTQITKLVAGLKATEDELDAALPKLFDQQAKQAALLKDVIVAAEGIKDASGNFGSTPGLAGGDMVKKMAQMNMEFLALQEATQMEARKFQTLSNASRARHDIALNAIKNLK